MNLFDILDNGNRVLVHSNADGFIITWNKSQTLQSWKLIPAHTNEVRDEDTWEETDVRVLPDAPASFDEACLSAKEWERSQNADNPFGHINT